MRPLHNSVEGKERKEGKEPTSNGFYVIGSLGLAILGLGTVAFPFLAVPARRKLGHIPWMATPHSVIKTTFEKLPRPSASASANTKLVDLGSGDGRFVIAGAKLGYTAIGFELNWVLVGMSYFNAIRSGVLNRVSFRMSDFWSAPLTDEVAVVSCFGVNGVMNRLLLKIQQAMRDSERKTPLTVVLFRFPLPPSALPNLVYSGGENELFIYRFKPMGINNTVVVKTQT